MEAAYLSTWMAGLALSSRVAYIESQTLRHTHGYTRRRPLHHCVEESQLVSKYMVTANAGGEG